MLDQYRRLKAEHPGSILFFRMGDFYETFGDDALLASRVLGITLTSRDKKKEGSIPLAGVPHHAVDGYLRTLVSQGHSVAIADQMETAAEARGLMERQITEVLTPGTITRGGILSATHDAPGQIKREEVGGGLPEGTSKLAGQLKMNRRVPSQPAR